MNPEEFGFVQQLVDRFLDDRNLSVSQPQPCPYLPGLSARHEGFLGEELPGAVYRALMDRGFRRSGRLVYRPVCADCNACRQVRVPVGTFKPSRSMRRVLRRNRDVSARVLRDPAPTRAKWLLFRAYLAARHDGQMADDFGSFTEFLYESPVSTVEFEYRLGGDLIGVSVVDLCPAALSSVYMYFDPDHGDRSLGTYSVLREIEYCREQGVAYYYLGYLVRGAATMEYKARYRPLEWLDEKHEWQILA